MTASLVTGVLGCLAGLTPQDRWQAARRFDSNIAAERWFVLAGLAVMLVLMVLLLLVTFSRRLREKKTEAKSFAERAHEWGLSPRERQMLLGIAAKAGLKRSQSVFTMASAFDRGAARVIEQGIEGQQPGEKSEQLRIEMSFLREKLGFRRQRLAQAGPSGVLKTYSSRRIPVGKELQLTRRRARGSGDIAATVVTNTDSELSVRLAAPLRITFGEVWCVRYYAGTSVWEFDTSVVSYDGGILTLNHSDNVRFVNRRRFLRVPVGRRAYIARFPFTRVLAGGAEESTTSGGSATTLGGTSERPEFVPAAVTELAGPGLRVESALEVNVGERILVVFRLDDERDRSSTTGQEGGKSATYRIVEDVGEVRHIQPAENGFSIAVELTGLSDTDIDELICATNAALLKGGAGVGDASACGGEPEPVSESSVGQGA